MDKLENKQYSFWELLEKVGIEIPIIQRDYAQGRSEKKVKDIRKKFLSSLYDALNNSKPLNLDFVYGTVNNGYLIPLDGQQRLTTLFLLHYFLALKDDKLNNENKEVLKKFTYKTRVSSREFCKLLVENKIDKNDNLISDTIKNQTWFFSEWENDPTIRAMLTMLDAIQETFKKSDNFFDKLTKNNITFSFLNLKDFKLSDDLYIKMNARGKPLSDFENFKSRFIEHIDKSELEDKEYIKAKLDNDWLDIFWKLEENNLKKSKNQNARKEILKQVDDKYLNFFKNITLFFDTDKKAEDIDIFSFKYSKENIEELKIVLDNLISYENNIIEKIRDKKEKFQISIFEDFLKKDLNYTQRARFYALMQFYLYLRKNNNNQNLFLSYMRVCINIIHNIPDGYDNFRKIIKVIDEIIKCLDDNKYQFYKNIIDTKISNFIKEFEAEIVKAKLIVNNSENQPWDWEEEFIDAEKHWYLDGQIGFLIDYAKWNFNDFSNFNDFYEFKIYKDKFIALWNFAKENQTNETLIHRTLLTIGDYTQTTKHNDKYTFCTFGTGIREKNENWKKVFTNKIFKCLLDKLNNEDIEIQLNNIINSYKFDYTNWKSYIINPNKNWTILDETKNYQIFKIGNNINLSRSGSGVLSWGWSRVHNLYSYYLYRYLKYDLQIEIKPFKNIEPYQSTTNPCFYFDNLILVKNDINYNFALDITFEDGKFKAKFFDRNKNNIEDKYILDGFKLDNEQNKYIKVLKYINPQEVKEEIKDILKDACKKVRE